VKGEEISLTFITIAQAPSRLRDKDGITKDMPPLSLPHSRTLELE